MMQTARDMDFLKLKENVTTAIFNQLKIPLPLISPDNQSYANMQAANLQLFSNAVLPLADRIFEELSLFLLPRYTGTEGMALSYDKSKVDALALATAESLKLRSTTGHLTVNELRAIDGREEVDGGDVILRPANELPVAEDRFTDDNLKKPASKSHFFSIMRKNTDLPEEELRVIARKHGLI
jgi:phage portal protein BeeE